MWHATLTRLHDTYADVKNTVCRVLYQEQQQDSDLCELSEAGVEQLCNECNIVPGLIGWSSSKIANDIPSKEIRRLSSAINTYEPT